MTSSKKKAIAIISIIIVILVIGVLIFFFVFKGDDNYGLKMSGTYYDNVSDFGDTNEDTLSGLPKAYLEHITYEITEIDKNKMIATLVVSVPDITGILPSLIDQIMSIRTPT